MKSTILSIITPTFQHERFISSTIESVLNQSGDFYVDYIIIDGDSKDRNVEKIKQFEELLRKSCDKKEIDGHEYYVNKSGENTIKCLGLSYRWVSEPDEGQADAINKGITMAFGDIFAYINSDDTYEPGAFQTISDEFLADQVSDVIYGNALYIDENGKVTGMYPPQDINKQSINVNCVISQPSAFVRMSTVKKFGGFNKRFKNSLDYEYWLRLWHGGAKFKFIQPVLSSTRLHDMTKTKLNREVINMESLAAITQYNKRVPIKAQMEFASEMSLLGRLFAWSRTLNKIAHKLVMRLYAPFFFNRHKDRVEQTRQSLFPVEDHIRQ